MAERDMYNQRYQAEGPPPYHPSTIKQWVKRVVRYSSQYNNSSWSADQTIGCPQVYPRHGDIHGAWASAQCDKNQFIELEFDVMVKPTALNIYETFNPGATVAIKAQNAIGKWITLWSTSQAQRLTQSRIFSPSLSDAVIKTNVIRLELDMTKAGTWCEIDAVELVGIRDGAVMPADDGGFFLEMGNLVNNKLHSDMKFELDGKSVYAHKAILATRSPYFCRMFDKSSKKAEMKLPDISFTDIIAILTFIYTNRLPSECSVATLTSIVKHSPVFDMPAMFTAATYKVLEVINIRNVVSIFIGLKSEHSFDELENLCKKFMADNLKDMSKEKSFQTLPQSDMIEVIQIATSKINLDSQS